MADDDASIKSHVTLDEGSTTTASFTKANEAPKPVIGEKENRRVFYSRLLVFGVFMVSAAVTGGLTYWLTSKEEEDTF